MTTGLKAATRSPRAASAAQIAAATTVLPTPVSVPVTKRPRRARRRRARPSKTLRGRRPARPPGARPRTHAPPATPRGLAQLGLGVRRHHREPQPRACPPGTVGGRIAWANTPRSSARSQAAIAASASPTTSGTICVVGLRHRQALLRQRLAQHRRVALQLLDAPRLLAQQLERRQRRRHGRRRQRGREDQRARGVDQVLGHRAVAAARRRRRSRAPCRACRRSRRPRPRARPRRPRPRPSGPERAGAVRLVDHHARVVALRQLDDLAASGATSPSIEKTPSVTIRRPRPSAWRSPHSRWSVSQWS